MSEIKTKGIVVSSNNYKEKDKIINIYSLENGLINAKLVGVKNQNAKMKPLKEIFCFAEFDLVSKNNDYFTVTSANIIETFYNITSDIDKYYAGCTILEVLRVVGKGGISNERLFIEALKALKILAYVNINEDIVLIKFLIKIFEAMGYQLTLDKCSSCGQAFIGKRYFNYSEGEITCTACKGPNAEIIEPLTHSVLRIVSLCNYDKLNSLKLKKEGLSSALDLLLKNFSSRFDFILSASNKFPKQ